MRAISGGTLSLDIINALDMGKQSRIAAITLLMYDYIITLELEVELIWRQKKHGPLFFLYLFNRFFALAFLIFDSIPLTKTGTVMSHVCVIYLMCDNIVTLITTLTVQALLQLRVYALYERSFKILIFMLVWCAIEVGLMAVLAGLTFSHLKGLPLVSTSTGCYYNGLLPSSALFWVPGLVYEPILFLLVAIKAWPTKQGTSQVPLVKRIARDSLIYFIVIFAELLLSTIVWARAPMYINMVMPWSAALPSILGSRLMLNMREVVLSKGRKNSYILESYAISETAYFHFPSAPDMILHDEEFRELTPP